MRLPLILLGILGSVVCFGPEVLGQQVSGEDDHRMLVVRREATIKSESTIKRVVCQGTVLEYTKENGAWLWIPENRGWARRQDVVPLSDALDQFGETIRRAPRNASAYINRAMAWRAQGELDIAMKDALDAIRLEPGSETAYFCRGIIYQDQGKLQQATKDFTKALKLNPDFAVAQLQRADARLRLQEVDNAVEDISVVMRANPKVGYYVRLRADTRRIAGRHEKAIEDYNLAIQLDATDHLAFNNRGYTWDLLDEEAKALADYSRAIELFPDDVTAYGNRALTYESKGEVQKGIQDISTAIKVLTKPGTRIDSQRVADFLFRRGEMYRKSGSANSALQDFDKAIEHNPAHWGAFNSRGIVWEVDGQLEKAFEDYSRAIQIDPEAAAAYINRGDVLKAQGKLKDSYADYTKAIELSPRSALALNNRGALFLKNDQFEDALKDFNAALEIAPDFYRCLDNRGFTWNKLGEYDNAIADCEAALKVSPKYLNAIFNRSVALGNRALYNGDARDDAAAIEGYAQVLQQNPNSVATHFERAKLHWNFDRNQIAVDGFNEVLKLQPEHVEAIFYRSQAYRDLGNLAEAIRGFGEVLKRSPKVDRAYFFRGKAYLAQGNVEEALTDYGKAIELSPEDNSYRLERSSLFQQRQSYDRALEDLDAAVQNEPDSTEALNRRAWLLATAPDDKVRNGRQAVKDSSKAVELSESQKPSYLDTLAVAHAERGHFDKALDFSEQAKELAEEDPDLLDEIEEHIAFFQQGKPYRIGANLSGEERSAPPIQSAAKQPDETPAPKRTVSANPINSKQLRNNMKQVLLAMQLYVDRHGHFPPAVVSGEGGNPPYSWRVALLPYLEKAQEEEHIQQEILSYHFDEPWDSEHNRKIASQMPEVYRTHVGLTEQTGMVVPVGSGTMFSGDKGIRFSNIIDGTSYTIALLRANAENVVPWTKPIDLPAGKNRLLERLLEPGSDTFDVAFADGSVHQLKTRISAQTFEQLITPDDGEIVDLEQIEQPEKKSRSWFRFLAEPGEAPPEPVENPSP